MTPLDAEDIRAKLQRLAEQGVEALCVSLINSFAKQRPREADRRHRRRGARTGHPGVAVLRGAAELREYERTVTTVASGSVQPQVARYVTNLAAELADAGVDGPLYILRSDGGLASATAAAASPVNLLLSGPAGGVTGAAWVAGQAGHDFLTFDMGGTSTDVALVQDLKARIGRQTREEVWRILTTEGWFC